MNFINNALKHGSSDWWRYCIGLLCIFLFYLAGQFPIAAVLAWCNSQGISTYEFTQTMDFSTIGIDKSLGLILMLIPPVLGFFGIFIVNKIIHHREKWTLLSKSPKFNWKKFFLFGGMWFGLSLLLEIIGYLLYPEDYILTFNLAKFLPLLFIVLIFIPLQTSFEELVFRGYLMQGFYNIFKHPVVPIIITGVLFGLLHGANPEAYAFGFWKMMIYYIGFGVFMGVVVVLDKGLEIALGIHAFNNIFGSLIVSFPESALQTDTIFMATEMNIDAMIVSWLIISTIFFAILYKMNNWNYSDLLKSE